MSEADPWVFIVFDHCSKFDPFLKVRSQRYAARC